MFYGVLHIMNLYILNHARIKSSWEENKMGGKKEWKNHVVEVLDEKYRAS